MLKECISSASCSDTVSHNYAKRAVTSFFKSYPCSSPKMAHWKWLFAMRFCVVSHFSIRYCFILDLKQLLDVLCTNYVTSLSLCLYFLKCANFCVFLYPPQTVFVEGIRFSSCPSDRPSVRPIVRPFVVRPSVLDFQYLEKAMIEFHKIWHIDIHKINIYNRKIRARGQFI